MIEIDPNAPDYIPYTDGLRWSYPWDHWLNGNVYVLQYGQDFERSRKAFLVLVRRTAKKRGLGIAMRKHSWDDSRFVIRAFPLGLPRPTLPRLPDEMSAYDINQPTIAGSRPWMTPCTFEGCTTEVRIDLHYAGTNGPECYVRGTVSNPQPLHTQETDHD